MQEYFYSLCDALFKTLQSEEKLLISFTAEDSDFVRLNHNKIRQAGSVSQREISLDLIEGKRHAEATANLSGDADQDLKQLTAVIIKLREQCEFLPEDPYLNFSTELQSSEYHHDKSVVDSQQAIEQIIQSAEGMDLVGIFANGTQYSGFANSMGQRNWHSSANFNFDWSCYYEQDKAVKSSYAGFDWQLEILNSKIANIKQQLDVLKRPAKTIQPGQYRAYLAPSAVDEIISLMSWGGFGLKSHRTKTTPLIQMLEQGRELSPAISLSENNARGLAPTFTSNGFIKPDEINLIKNGQYKNCLVNPRSAKEFNSITNTDSEFPGALDLQAGELAEENILKKLGSGLYINNLWYLNFSDRSACQLTGMTRFACFWVEDGIIQAPVNVMRFDDNVYDLFGSNLLELTKKRELILDASSYGQRSNSSIELPGALVKAMRFTL